MVGARGEGMNVKPLRLWRVTARVTARYLGPAPREYVDWYEAGTEKEARELSDEDAHRYGLPMGTEFSFVECDRKTLKPISPTGQ